MKLQTEPAVPTNCNADCSTAYEALRARYERVRARTSSLAEPLSAEDCCVQSMPDASPVKWHIAHTSWFFETFILEQHDPDFRPFNAEFRILFNSYYNGIGEKHPRAQRGMLTRPSLAEVQAYRRHIDERMIELLTRPQVLPAISALVEIGLQHEQQHQELMLTDVKHLLSNNPLLPAYAPETFKTDTQSLAFDWFEFASGVVEIGYCGNGFCFDNEMPRHRQFVERFAIASRLITNGEFLAFIEAGGYTDPAYWLSQGWDWVRDHHITRPLYWQRAEAGHSSIWQEFTLYGLQPLDLARSAMHLSYFEADAYARWAGARLPTEAEWEHAAAEMSEHVAVERLHPQASDQPGLSQLFGTSWQWTSSSYAPYPGYEPEEGLLGEYNGKFMVNQYVLRGSSCVTPAGHTRQTYRNFFPADARWQFTGIRLAKSIRN